MRQWLFVFSMALLSLSCEKLQLTANKLTQLTLNYQNTVLIPKTDSLLNQYTLLAEQLPTDIQNLTAAQQTSAELISDIRVSDITVYIDSPLTQEFDPLTEVHVFISASGQAEIEVASLIGLSNEVESAIELDVVDVNLKPYLAQNQFNTRIVISTDDVLPQDTRLRCDMKFAVQASLLGD